MISTAIQQLVNYGLDTGLILPDDEIYIRNQLLMTMQLDDFTAPDSEVCYTDLESILKTLVDDAVARGVCEDNSTARDLFDTKLMGVLTPRPSIVRANFEERYENEGPQAATDWFYKFSQDTDYIRRYRIKRDLKWVTKTEYGDLDITINLSKPEKDPKAIAAAKHFLNGAGAVRVHGGGFAGTVQAFVPLEKLDVFKAEMEAILGAGKCHILSIRPEGGAVL